MMTFIATCVGIITVLLAVGLGLWVGTLLQIRRTAEALEVLAYEARGQLGRLRAAADGVGRIAGTMGSSWLLRAASAGLGVATAMWARRPKTGKHGGQHDG